MLDHTEKDKLETFETVGVTPDVDTVDDGFMNHPSSESGGSFVLLDESVFVGLDEDRFADLA